MGYICSQFSEHLFTKQANQIDRNGVRSGTTNGVAFQSKKWYNKKIKITDIVPESKHTKRQKNEILKKILRKTEEIFEESQHKGESEEAESLIRSQK
jgi:hypothetical protein